VNKPKLALIFAAAAICAVGATVPAMAGHESGRAHEVAAAVAPTFQPATELSYVPVTPCRIADTRHTHAIRTGTVRRFHVTGTAGFPTAGGKSGGCGVPAAASVAAVSVTTTASTGTGRLTVFAAGSARPAAVQSSYRSGANTTTQVNASLSNTTGLVSVYASRQTHVIMDVSGYYVKPLAGFIAPSGATYAGSSRILSSTRISDPGVYEVQFDRDVQYCSAVATPYYYNYYASTDAFGAASTDTLRVRLWDHAGAAVNGYFSITVTC